jgi:hypothetical protein
VRGRHRPAAESTDGVSGDALDSRASWTRTQSIRTVAQIQVWAALFETAPLPVYQQIAPKAKHLRELGMSHKAIARALGVNDKTVTKAIAWFMSAD